MRASEFKVGDKVLYVPAHAHGDHHHPDCERGIVSSIKSEYVFVRYYQKDGSLSVLGHATRPEDLVTRESGT